MEEYNKEVKTKSSSKLEYGSGENFLIPSIESPREMTTNSPLQDNHRISPTVSDDDLDHLDNVEVHHNWYEEEYIKVTTNDVALTRADGGSLTIYQHDVKILSNVVLTPKLYKKQFRADVASIFGPHWCDSELRNIYTLDPIIDEQSLTFFGRQNNLNNRLAAELTIEGCKAVAPDSYLFRKIYNLIIRGLVSKLEIQDVNGVYFSNKKPATATVATDFGPIEMKPGFSAVIGSYGPDEVLLRIDPTYEFFGGDNNLLKMINGADKELIRKRFVGQKVTSAVAADSKVYQVVNFEWGVGPLDLTMLDKNGELVSVSDLYRQQGYQVSSYQPLIRCVEVKASNANNTNKIEFLFLVPEVHQLVGLLEEMKKDVYPSAKSSLPRIPRDRLNVADKAEVIRMQLTWHPKVMDTLDKLGLRLDKKFLTCKARVLPKVKLWFGVGVEDPDDLNQWTSAFDANGMAQPVDLTNWSLVAPAGAIPSKTLDGLVTKMIEMSPTLGFEMKMYSRKVLITCQTLQNYFNACEVLSLGSTSFILVCVPKQFAELIKNEIRKQFCKLPQGTIIRFLEVDESTLNDIPKLRTFMTNLNVANGGVPWKVDFGIDDESIGSLMLVGFDTTHTYTQVVSHYDVLGRKRKIPLKKWQSVIIGATVASTNSDFTKYFASTFIFDRDGEVGNLVKLEFLKCLNAYRRANGDRLPSKIIFYHGYVGEIDFEDIKSIELDQLKAILQMQYQQLPEFVYITVNKESHSRLFDEHMNEAPVGTVVDEKITFPGRADFYLISKMNAAMYYNIIYDSSKLWVKRIQRLTYKFCHLGFDENETTEVPAPLYYATKLANNLKVDIDRDGRD